jgi:hypothetical protein
MSIRYRPPKAGREGADSPTSGIATEDPNARLVVPNSHHLRRPATFQPHLALA